MSVNKNKKSNRSNSSSLLIKKLLVANRGEIAVRIFQTAHEMGITTVAVYSDADAEALHVKIADEAVAIGGLAAADSYLVMDKIIDAAKLTGVDAIHPGYGFLSENAAFAKRCADEGLIFIGPTANAIEQLGNKSKAKELMKVTGVPVVPGYNGEDQNYARFEYEAEEIGYPVLLKASAGGGGKGMRIVNSSTELKHAFEAAQREAEKSFGDASLLIEKYFPSAKHIEVQVMGDEHGNIVHLGERECSLQRRYQKLVEESPSPSIDSALRQEICEAAVTAAKAVNYTNAGTVEFVLDDKRNFYFLEVNTRLQVEHPVTEMTTMLDLVRLQIQIAEGQALPEYVRQLEVSQTHSIECRICAEDPTNNFFPSTGEILLWREPEADSVRVDTGIETGTKVGIHYDSMLAKIIVVEENRQQAIRLMNRALERLTVLGITTNKDFLRSLINHPQFIDATFDTKLIEREFSNYKSEFSEEQIQQAAIAGLLHGWFYRSDKTGTYPSLNGWRNIGTPPQEIAFEMDGKEIKLQYIVDSSMLFAVTCNNNSYKVSFISFRENELCCTINNRKLTFLIAQKDEKYFIQHPLAGQVVLNELPRFPINSSNLNAAGYTAPMPGEIVRILVKSGDNVTNGQALIVMNSMKMETTITAQADGVVDTIQVNEKSFVDAGTTLLTMKQD